MRFRPSSSLTDILVFWAPEWIQSLGNGDLREKTFRLLTSAPPTSDMEQMRTIRGALMQHGLQVHNLSRLNSSLHERISNLHGVVVIVAQNIRPPRARTLASLAAPKNNMILRPHADKHGDLRLDVPPQLLLPTGRIGTSAHYILALQCMLDSAKNRPPS